MKLQSIIKGVAGWLGAERKQTSRRSMRRPALKLEALEERDCPSTFGDALQFQNDLNVQAYFNGSAFDTPILQNDINQVISAARYSQNDPAVQSAVQNLQSAMSTQSMWGSYALSNSPVLQNDLQVLLGDANGYGYGGGYGIDCVLKVPQSSGCVFSRMARHSRR